MRKLALTSLLFALSACTLTFTEVETVGEAHNTIDEKNSASPDIKATVPIIP